MPNVAELNAKVRQYGEDAESWKIDHDNAMFCLSVEKQLIYGLYLYSRIELAETRLRDLVALGKMKAPEASGIVCALWDWWLASEQGAKDAIGYCKTRSHKVDQADRFRRLCERARSRDLSDFDDIAEIKEALEDPARTSHEDVLRELGFAK